MQPHDVYTWALFVRPHMIREFRLSRRRTAPGNGLPPPFLAGPANARLGCHRTASTAMAPVLTTTSDPGMDPPSAPCTDVINHRPLRVERARLHQTFCSRPFRQYTRACSAMDNGPRVSSFAPVSPKLRLDGRLPRIPCIPHALTTDRVGVTFIPGETSVL